MRMGGKGSGEHYGLKQYRMVCGGCEGGCLSYHDASFEEPAFFGHKHVWMCVRVLVLSGAKQVVDVFSCRTGHAKSPSPEVVVRCDGWLWDARKFRVESP